MSPPAGDIRAEDVSTAWLGAVAALNQCTPRAKCHFVVRIANPIAEIAEIRQLANQLMAELRMRTIDTVRNTIFPADNAARFPEPHALARHYRAHYAVVRRFNKRGTYFGRLVALPNGEGDSIDQLSSTVSKLRSAGRKLSSRYELNVYLAELDLNVRMGFPCMSSCAFHLDGSVLHMLALYRHQYLIERGYGNYLGLGQLLDYVCRATNLRMGELMVVAGRAAIDRASRRRISRLLADARS